MTDDFFDPIYKGCTAPSTIFGVPLVPFILGALVFAQLMLVSFYFIGLSVSVAVFVMAVFVYLWARKVGREDEHRLLQYVLKMRMRGSQTSTRRFWNAVSFSPLPSRK